MIVADTSWVVAVRDPQDVRHPAARAAFDAVGDEQVLLAPLTLAECLVGPARLGRAEEAERDLRAAFDVAVDDVSAPLRWALRRAGSGLRLPDAVVLETAVAGGARAVLTYDERLARACTAAGITPLG